MQDLWDLRLVFGDSVETNRKEIAHFLDLLEEALGDPSKEGAMTRICHLSREIVSSTDTAPAPSSWLPHLRERALSLLSQVGPATANSKHAENCATRLQDFREGLASLDQDAQVWGDMLSACNLPLCY